MPKVTLIGSPQCQWDISGHMRPGGTIVDLTDAEFKKHNDIIDEVLDKSSPSAVKYTAKELKDLKKSEQVKILNDFGIEKIPRYEDQRIDAILEAQK